MQRSIATARFGVLPAVAVTLRQRWRRPVAAARGAPSRGATADRKARPAELQVDDVDADPEPDGVPGACRAEQNWRSIAAAPGAGRLDRSAPARAECQHPARALNIQISTRQVHRPRA
jgi:hypothetical protein